MPVTPETPSATEGLVIVQAQAAPAGEAAPQAGFLQTMPMLIAIFAIFYFFLIRPQNKAREEHSKLIGGLKKGDEVVTEGGIFGTIYEVRDDRVLLEVSSGVRIAIAKSSVANGVVETAPEVITKEG